MISCRSPRPGQGQVRPTPAVLAMSTHSKTVTGKSQLTVSSWGT